VYFDGACPLCAKEIGHYRRLDSENRIMFWDLSTKGVDERLAGEGVTLSDAMARMHVIDRRGELATGFDAFSAMWEALPYWRWLAPVARLSPVRVVGSAAYEAWAARRLRLTGRSDGSCRRPEP